MFVSLLCLWVAFSVAAAIFVGIDLVAYRQRSWMMNIAWPVMTLAGGMFGLWGYFAVGRVD